MVRDKVVYIPYPVKGNRINEYTSNMVKLLKKDYSVLGNLAEPTDIFQMLQTKAVFLNWMENGLDKKLKLQLLLHKIFGAKIVWVFHNKQPHEVNEADITQKNVQWLAEISSIIMLHSKCSKKYIPHPKRNGRKAVYVPHVMYEEKNSYFDPEAVREKYGIEAEDFVFTIFGLVRPYKNIEGGIEAFTKLSEKNCKLLIVGQPMSSSYAKEIENLSKGNENIILDLKYISDEMLEAVLAVSDVVVIPYKSGSSMNSGVMIQAFSKGKTVIAPDIAMARDMRKTEFFYMYRSNLTEALKKAYGNGKEVNRAMGKAAMEYMQAYNNKELVYYSLCQLLNKRHA